MGYIQFDKVDVPEDNVVSLVHLNKQLQKQLEKQRGRARAGPTAETATDRRGHVLRTTASPTSVSTAEIWRLLLDADAAAAGNARVSEPVEKPSLDEELCGMRFDTVSAPMSAPALAHSDSSTPTTVGAELELELELELQLGLGLELELGRDVLTSAATAASVSASASASAAPFQCPHCPSHFKVKGYLTRHMKKHAANKDFRCPYWSTHCKCHPTGEFSRKDTFKTHLKSIHFVYPVGVIKSQRNRSKGRCAACFQEFDSNSDWLAAHVETGACKGLSAVKSEDSAWQYA